ncbi:putative quinol monooxygenase [Vibrio rumoiensis]|uniref:Antibiotic biosynthesis monooxygenase n=1 Tax=Vibrio rumoiensis 1S-45 TaxID=1188252 RepID=A0A1E5E5T5_9VIBR|nr:antibiotic biosynthesis monooxygenase family protein [Vibrio rumoiensis]OEF29207.1 antibiotic biosynthesis monooxygenase [Vibrio rumoiensis 1S-45]
MSKVTLKGHIIIPTKDLSVVLAELVNHQRLTLEEPGCLVFNVTQCTLNPQKFNVYEEFIDTAAFELHQKRVKASHWGKVTTNVKRYYEITQ